MGSLIVKIDETSKKTIENKHHYSDIDMLDAKNYSVLSEVPFVYDVDAVKQSIRNILMWRVGESVLRPRFGHNIHQSLYKQLNQFNKDKVAEEVKRALEENEPRIQVLTVALKTTEQDDESNSLKVRIAYKVIGDKSSTKHDMDVSISNK